MAITAYIFDLDMTLLNSSALADARKQGDWDYVRNNIKRVRPFTTQPLAPHAVVNQLDAQGYKIGIVTSSPKWYAKKLLSKYAIAYDALVAYEDTINHKPNPEPITKILSNLSVTPHDAIYIGDEVSDVQAAYHAKVLSIGAGWGVRDWVAFTKAAPDILLHTPEPLLRPTEFKQLKYIGSYRANPFLEIFDTDPEILHPGSILKWETDIPLYSLARYFSTKDPRHASDWLSKNILSLKNDNGSAAMFGKAVGTAINNLLGGWRPDYIVPVPPKPRQTRNRFEQLLQHALPLPKGVEVDLNGLVCVREIDGYKKMRPNERAEAIRGAYDTKYDWDGHSVLLLDDVYTSGETITECARVLDANNAGEIRGLTLAIDQDSFDTKQCPLCGSRLQVRSSSRGQFWGCSRWRPENAGCNYTENI